MSDVGWRMSDVGWRMAELVLNPGRGERSGGYGVRVSGDQELVGGGARGRSIGGFCRPLPGLGIYWNETPRVDTRGLNLSPLRGLGNPDVGCRMSDVGGQMSEVGCWMLDVGCWMAELVLNPGRGDKNLATGVSPWLLGLGHRTPTKE